MKKTLRTGSRAMASAETTCARPRRPAIRVYADIHTHAQADDRFEACRRRQALLQRTAHAGTHARSLALRLAGPTHSSRM